MQVRRPMRHQPGTRHCSSHHPTVTGTLQRRLQAGCAVKTSSCSSKVICIVSTMPHICYNRRPQVMARWRSRFVSRNMVRMTVMTSSNCNNSNSSLPSFPPVTHCWDVIHCYPLKRILAAAIIVILLKRSFLALGRTEIYHCRSSSSRCNATVFQFQTMVVVVAAIAATAPQRHLRLCSSLNINSRLQHPTPQLLR